MVLIPQVQCIRKTSLYKTLWMSIPVVSGPDKSSRMMLQSSGCLALRSGTFFSWRFDTLQRATLVAKSPPQMTPDCTDQASDPPSDMGTTHTPDSEWHLRRHVQFLLVSAHIPMMKDPLPIILCNNSNYHKPTDGVLEISRILEIELGVALFFGLSAQVNNLDQTLKRMLNDDLLVLFLCKM